MAVDGPDPRLSAVQDEGRLVKNGTALKCLVRRVPIRQYPNHAARRLRSSPDNQTQIPNAKRFGFEV
jgi:hypothetical protein